MSINHKMQQLKKHLQRHPFQKYGYRIELFQKQIQGAITFEEYHARRKVDYIMKKLGYIQCGKPSFLCSRDPIQKDFDTNLAGFHYEQKHHKKWRLCRVRQSKQYLHDKELDKKRRERIRIYRRH